MYPFGTHRWTLDGEVCQMQAGTEIQLTLSVCGKGEFTCADGNCIDLSLRCNLRIDCPDESDESLCSVVDIPPGYNTNIPPPSAWKGNPLDVKLGIQLIAFPSIVTQDLSMTATFKLSLQWKDIRLNYLNLKEDRSLNKLSSKDVDDIWTPRVHFSNALGNVFTNLGPGSRLECLRESPSSPGPPHLPVEGMTKSSNYGKGESIEVGGRQASRPVNAGNVRSLDFFRHKCLYVLSRKNQLGLPNIACYPIS